MNDPEYIKRINAAIDRWNTLASRRDASFDELRDGLLELQRETLMIDKQRDCGAA